MRSLVHGTVLGPWPPSCLLSSFLHSQLYTHHYTRILTLVIIAYLLISEFDMVNIGLRTYYIGPPPLSYSAPLSSVPPSTWLDFSMWSLSYWLGRPKPDKEAEISSEKPSTIQGRLQSWWDRGNRLPTPREQWWIRRLVLLYLVVWVTFMLWIGKKRLALDQERMTKASSLRPGADGSSSS